MKELYEKFYERGDLKNVRNLLDGNDQGKISELVEAECPNFTDYLNFFEFLAYLHLKAKQISKEEVFGLFQYYLKNLNQHKDVVDYINTHSKSFEQLKELLKLIEKRNGK